MRKKRTLLIIFVISSLVCLAYEFTINIPEWFWGAEAIFKLITQISYGMIASCIFYYITIYLVDKRKRKKFKEPIRIRINRILFSMRCIIGLYVFNDTSAKEFTNVNQEIIKERSEKILFNDVIYNTTYLEYFGKEVIFIENVIWEIYAKFSTYMDDEDLELLDKTMNLQFVLTMSHHYKSNQNFGEGASFKSYSEYLYQLFKNMQEIEFLLNKYSEK